MNDPIELIDEEGGRTIRAEMGDRGLQGPVVIEDPEAGLVQVTEFVDGVPNGRATLAESGRPRLELRFVDGVRHGEVVVFHPNGSPNQRAFYVRGALDGESRWFDADGRLLRKALYSSGRLTGPVDTYGPEEALVERAEFEDDVQHGLTVRYDLDGEEIGRWRYELGEVVEGPELGEGSGQEESVMGRWTRRLTGG